MFFSRFEIGHSREFLENISQDAWKIFISLRIFILPDIFRADYTGWKYFIFAQQQILCSEIFMRFFLKMLGKILGNFGNVRLFGKL